MTADPKAPARIVDRQAWKAAVKREPLCVICFDMPSQSAHHILKRSQRGDDVAANLVGVCGDGTRGCHGRLEAEDEVARKLLGEYVAMERDDFVDYLIVKLGGPWPAVSFLSRRLLYDGADVVGGIVVT
jgi:hypothetical protein